MGVKFTLLVLASIMILGTFSFSQVFATTEEAKLTASDGDVGDLFGLAVAISGDTAIVNARFDNDAGLNSGSAYVFVRSGTTWTEQAKLTASDAAAGDEFGVSVAISGDTAIVGSHMDDEAGSGSGSAYVFVRSGSTWTEQAKLTASDAAAGDLFGHNVVILGDTAIVSAHLSDDAGPDSGSAYVFARSGSTWTEQAKLTASDAAPSNFFGHNSGISGDTIIVGAENTFGTKPFAGAAYVFTKSGSTWTEQAKLTASDAAKDDHFGHSVEISGDTAMVGAFWDDDAGSKSGSAYVFVRSGSTWTEQAKLTASDAAVGDWFGHSTSIIGDTALIGSERDNDAGPDSGSVYVFERSGSTWTEQAKLTASDAAPFDFFGHWVSFSGDTAIVSSHFDDDVGFDSGSAYVYSLVDTDGDGILDVTDNCPNTQNPGQEDIDVDGIGDVCDTLHLISSGTAFMGTFTILTGQTLQVEPGVWFYVPDGSTVNNNSDLTINNFGVILNFGTINNAGTFNNHPGAVLSNSATGTINNNAGATINVNAGSFVLNKVGASIVNNPSGTVNLPGGTLVNQNSGSSISNGGTITSSGIIWSAGANTINTGTITKNSGGFMINDQSSTLSNNSGGTITIGSGAVLINDNGSTLSNNSGGSITNNFGTFANLNGAIIDNNSGGLITNNNSPSVAFNGAGSTTNNNAGATIDNSNGGLWVNVCGGILNDLGTILGTITQLGC